MFAGVRFVWQRLFVGMGAGTLVLSGLVAGPPAAAADPCVSGNAVACENSKPGDDPSAWDIAPGWGAGDQTIQGFATSMSVNPGQTVQFKIKALTNAPYTIDIYRLGYYGGQGARRQAPTITVGAPKSQPACIADASTHNYDCGNWSVSSQWAVPSTAVSGVYVATLNQGTDRSQITFVVRDDSSHSDVVFKTSDATWQAYNAYGGSDFYTAPTSLTGSQARAFKISYNRPFATRGSSSGRDFLFSNEYPTLRFLERNGVDVSYTTDLDVSVGTTTLTNHKVFMSVGHDEYWTLPERQHVEAARDAGVNLMFLSGNEVYWHARLEPSIDGTSTPNRTLVCYKDSWEPAPIDPAPEGTGTWRDPRFKAAPNGSNPENSLTGTIYMSNNTDLAITVSAAQGKTRLWRGTSLASLPSGGSATLAPHTVGYESDEDVGNAARPAGLMRLSQTTGPTDQLVQDVSGTQVAPGTTTHSITLYRAASGALVFGAGTIQWGWGLDQYHDGDNSNPPDSRMQQATLNMLADMGALPTTLMAGLVLPSKSADTAAPAVSVTAPATNSTIANGSSVTVSGTATESGGGVVTTVEVSLDGGKTYHRATGTTTWTYTGILSGSGSSSIKARASDDSANLSQPQSVAITVACPCSLFGQAVPTMPAVSDTSSVELGVKFVPSADGFVSGIRFYKGSGNSGTHTGTLWTSSGQPLASGTFTSETTTGWQTLTFSSAVAVTGGSTYVASYYAPSGHYAADSNFFAAGDWTASPLSAPGLPSKVANGVYNNGAGFPSSSYSYTNYWVDVLYNRDDTTPPTVSLVSPLAGSSSVGTTVKPTATFAGTVDPSSVTFTLKDSTGATVSGSTSFDSTNRTATFTPAGPLSYGTSYTASVNAVSAAGVPMAAPYTWSFRTALTDPVAGVCPCSIWPDSATPATLTDPDTRSVELGVKFTADVTGNVAGIRFYKGPQNVGTHTGSLWTAGGTLLATVTFSAESSSGWQTAYFSAPVDIQAGTSYIASYRAPSGSFSYTQNGLSSAVDSPPLHAQAGGGLYTYGAGAPLTSTNTNYWVDLVFNATDSAPTVTSTSPGADATNVRVSALATATLSGQIKQGTGSLSLKDAAGTSVSGTSSYDATSRTITFTPDSALIAGVKYSATLSGATALSGNVMDPYTWSYTTASASACPCTLFESTAVPSVVDAGDASAIELGVSFHPTLDGMITGVRFYKSTLNSGTHTGSLWSATGTRLATGTFSSESTTGWQTLTFAQPVAVTSGTAYVVSYFTPNGHYSAAQNFFATPYDNGPLVATATNGLYRYGSTSGFPQDSYNATNYWVDPIFQPGTPPDLTPPTVSATAPVAGSSSQSTSGVLTATFDEAIDPSTLSFLLKDGQGATIQGAATYASSSKTATFTSSVALDRGKTYTATVSASDLAGNAMTQPKSWSFTTAQPDPVVGQCPCSLWTDATTPALIDQPDDKAVEVGVAFTTDTSGAISGLRFYKAQANTGTHTGSLWDASGTRLATATFTNETTEGWQTVLFQTPVSVTAGTTYLVSYNAPNGHYSVTASGLSAAVDTAPLHSLPVGGRYLYGAGFPSTESSTNYWVDPVFITGGGGSTAADTTAPAISSATASGSGTSATVSWTTDESSTSRVDYGTTTSLGSTTTGATGTSHSVTLAGLTANTRYYYRVTSADAAGNASVWPAAGQPPATWTPAVTPVVNSSVADFSGGTGGYIADSSGGEVMASPTAGAEFSGSALASGWSSTVLASGGTTSVSGGFAHLNGTNLWTGTYSSGRSFSSSAQLAPGGSIGWGSTAPKTSGVRAAFVASATGALSAAFSDAKGINTTVAIPGTWMDKAHEFRVDWSSSTATMFIDGTQVAASTFRPAVGLRFLASDPLTDGADLLIDWARIAPYASSSTYTSAVIDGLASVGWDSVTTDVDAAAGSGVTVLVRTGNTAAPGTGWTAWATVPAGGALNQTGRYLQYQLVTTTSGTRFVSSATKSVTIGFHVL